MMTNEQQRIAHLEKLLDDAAGEMSVLRKDNERQAAQISALVAENVAQKEAIAQTIGWQESVDAENTESVRLLIELKTPATDAEIAAIRADSRKEGAIFAANRMLAAWDAGFIDDTPENAADIARAILSTIEFMDDAPEGDFDRSFADEMFESIAAQLREGAQK